MPRVTSGETSTKYQIGLVAAGHVERIGIMAPLGYHAGQGGHIPAVVTKLDHPKKPDAKGLNFRADVSILGPAEKDLPDAIYGDRRQLAFHLCTHKDCKGGGKDRIHIQDWAYPGDNEPDSDAWLRESVTSIAPPPGLEHYQMQTPLKKAAHAHTCENGHGLVEVATKKVGYECDVCGVVVASAATVLRCKVCDFDKCDKCAKEEAKVKKIQDAPSPLAAPAGSGGLGRWVADAGVPELFDVLRAQGFRTVAELTTLTERDVDELWAGASASLGLGAKSRFRLGLKALRARESPMQQSPKVSEGPRAAPLGDRGGVGLANPLGGPSPSPLDELAAGARQLLGLPESIGAVPPQGFGAAGSAFQGVGLHAGRNLGMPPPMGAASPLTPPATTTASGRLIVQGVPLRVSTMQGPAIYEEWSDSGRKSLASSVMERSWKQSASRDTAYATARGVDVWLASGVAVQHTAAGEVMLRNLAATWMTDQNPKLAEVAALIRESDPSTWGVPRSLWEEARTLRRLMNGAHGTVSSSD
jgi:hypothetical protein